MSDPAQFRNNKLLLLDWQKLWAKMISPGEFLDIAIGIIGEPLEPVAEEINEHLDEPEIDNMDIQNNQQMLDRGIN